MTKLIAILIIALVAWGGYQLFLYWERVQQEEAEQRRGVAPERLPGMPAELESSLQQAQRAGPAAMREWLRVFGPRVQDPRRAWIELDFAVMVARDNIQEARQVFTAVRDRTPPTSPVYPRVKQLEKTFD